MFSKEYSRYKRHDTITAATVRTPKGAEDGSSDSGELVCSSPGEAPATRTGAAVQWRERSRCDTFSDVDQPSNLLNNVYEAQALGKHLDEEDMIPALRMLTNKKKNHVNN